MPGEKATGTAGQQLRLDVRYRPEADIDSSSKASSRLTQADALGMRPWISPGAKQATWQLT
jgi:hypothetical protein